MLRRGDRGRAGRWEPSQAPEVCERSKILVVEKKSQF